MSNLVPAFTFLLAVIFRMEKLDLRSSRNQIKIIAVFVSISGALVVTLCKGPSIGSFSKQSSSSQPLYKVLETQTNWVLGGLFLASASLFLSLWNTFQAAILKECPSQITIVSFYCLFGSIQCAVVALIAERNHPKAWILRHNIELVSVIYSMSTESPSTLLSCGIWKCGHILCRNMVHIQGPVFVAMFKPLGISIAALMGVIFLCDTLHVGSVIGAVLIIIGFYGVIWAQAKEQEKGEVCADHDPASSSQHPLLH